MIASDGQLFVFPSALGWMALVEADGLVGQLTFAHDSPQAAIRNLEPGWRHASAADSVSALAIRLQAYAEGAADDFLDVRLNHGKQTAFQARIRELCRRIPVGETRTYGRLAEAAGFPRAARAVGSVMSSNRIPILVPCHRVLRAGGQPGGYSAGAGLMLKLRLLEQERAAASNRPRRVAGPRRKGLCRA